MSNNKSTSNIRQFPQTLLPTLKDSKSTSNVRQFLHTLPPTVKVFVEQEHPDTYNDDKERMIKSFIDCIENKVNNPSRWKSPGPTVTCIPFPERYWNTQYGKIVLDDLKRKGFDVKINQKYSTIYIKGTTF